MKMVGIIFSNIYDKTMGELTRHRTVASLPFGGRYRLVDFVLSNMVNSSISTVGIITKYNYQSLMDHLGSCGEWDLNRKNGGLYFLPPYSSGVMDVYNGKLEALNNAISFLENANADYVLLSDSTVICNIDYEDVLASHMRSGADVTAVANKAAKEDLAYKQDVVLQMDKKKIIDMATKCEPREGEYVSMGMYIIERNKLLSVVRNAYTHGQGHFERDFLQRKYNDKSLKINVFEFKKTVLRNLDVVSYFENNMRLMEEEIYHDIFGRDNPIHTKVRDEVPSYYADDCQVNCCLAADGCIFHGTAEDSVIFRDVTVERGAIVKNSIVMQGTEIGKDSYIKYAIIDKDAVIRPNTTLVGSPTSPVFVAKGAIV